MTDTTNGNGTDTATIEALRREAQRLEEDATYSSKGHFNAEDTWVKRNYWLGVPATVLGAIQVPHAGQPVLFLADHPITGGYPVIGVLAPHHIARAGQIPPGARIRFTRLGTFAEEVILLPSGAPS